MTVIPPRTWPLPEPNPRIPAGAWSPALASHPCVLGPREFLRDLARRKPRAYREIRDHDDTLLAAGIVQSVEGAPDWRRMKFVNGAWANIARGVTNVHQSTWIWMLDTALAFDFFHDDFPPARRAGILAWLNAQRLVFTDDENAFHNSTLSKILVYLRIAYGTWGENPEAKDFRDHAIVKLYEGRVLPVLREFGSGGGYTECGWYCRHSILHLVEGLELARRFEGYDGFAKAPEFFYGRLAYDMLQPYPGTWKKTLAARSEGFRPRRGVKIERYANEGDGVNLFSGAMEWPLIMRTLLSQYFRGSELARYTAGRRRDAAWSGSRLLQFLYEEEPDPAAPPIDSKTFPLSHVAPGIGKVFARSGWTDNASWLRFECGPIWNQHQHFEAGNFEIFRREPLATETGEYTDWYSPHALNWLIRTVAHNCILIRRPGEVFKNIRNWKKIRIANDGGQGNDMFIVHTLPDWHAQRKKFERGRIAAFEDKGDWLYVAGDSTKAYSPSKAARVIREIVFLRPHLFIILDRVTSTKARYEKTWLLHCRREPKIAGLTARIADGEGKLFVRTLLPADARMRKVHGYAYRGGTYDPLDHKLSKGAVLWRIEVTPGAPRADDVFLHVLSTDGPVDADASRDGETVRILVAGREVMFAPGQKASVVDRGGRS